MAIIRRIAFTPIPHVDSYEALQEHVTNKCLQYIKTHTIQGREYSIDQLLQNEKNHLMPLPSVPLDPGYSTRVLVHPDLTVVHEGTHYSVPYILAGKIVTLVPSPFHIKIFYQGKEMWKHTRSLKKHQHQYVLEHYLEILQQKPRAIDQARPILKGIMPKECSEFLRLSRMENSKQQLIDTLLLSRHIPQDKLLWAVEQANNTHNPSFQLVKFFLNIEDFAAEPDTITVDHKDLEIYDALIPEGGDG